MKILLIPTSISLVIGTLVGMVGIGADNAYADDQFINKVKFGVESDRHNDCYEKNAGINCGICSNTSSITGGEQDKNEVKFSSKQINKCILTGNPDNLAISGNDISETRSAIINPVP